jgi:hypothetical protein
MGPFPFYRFSQSEVNAGFMPEARRISEWLDSVFNEFVDGFYVTDTISEAIKQIQEVIDTFNLPNIEGNFRLVYPSPFPAIGGIQTLEFYIQNDQLLGSYPDQKITISLDLEDGDVHSSIFTAPSIIPATGNYDAPVLGIELEVIRALQVYYANGAAIFPLTYSFDYSTGLATSSLALASNYQLDLNTGAIARSPVQVYPFAPIQYFPFSGLEPLENYFLTIMDKVVNYAIKNPTVDAEGLNDYGQTIIFNTDCVIVYEGSGDERISFEFTGSRRFFLIGRIDTIDNTWKFQRFFNPSNTADNQFFSFYSISTPLPYEPYGGSLLYLDDWYNFEQVQFDNVCEPEESDVFLMPIKTGDLLKFNLIPEQGNFTGKDTVSIGIVDSEGVFQTTIGDATFPSCKINFTFEVYFVQNFVVNIEATGSAIIWNYVDSNGDVTRDLFFIAYADLDTSGDGIDFWNSVVAQFNEFFPLWTVTFEITEGGDYLYFTVDNVECCVQGIGYDTELGVWPTPGFFNRDAACGCATQLQATVNIPYLPDGCYRFIIFDGEEIYSQSNLLSLNNSDCFSTIWKFGSSENVIIEGFEYYGGWLQRLRLPINGGGQKPKIEESIYRNSDGTYQRPSNYSDLTVDLHSDYLDLETRNAVASATRCPILIFDSQSIFVSGDLDVATVQDFSNKTSFRKLAQMKFSALIQGFQPDNNNCIGC